MLVETQVRCCRQRSKDIWVNDAVILSGLFGRIDIRATMTEKTTEVFVDGIASDIVGLYMGAVWLDSDWTGLDWADWSWRGLFVTHPGIFLLHSVGEGGRGNGIEPCQLLKRGWNVEWKE